MKYGFVADSGCDRLPEVQEYFAMVQAPLTLRIGGLTLTDDSALDKTLLHNAISNGREKIKSACPSPGEWAQAFVQHPAQTLFAAAIADHHSGSYNSALLGAELAREQGKCVHVFNSKSITCGELLVALQTKEALEAGLDFEQTARQVESFIDSMQTFAVLKNTDGLVRNGRMPNFLGKAVELLNLKLILCSDGQGVITLRSKARGFNNALVKMVELWDGLCTDFDKRTLIISHIENEEAALQVRDLAQKAYGFRRVILSEPGGLGSLYGGIGGLVVSF